MSSTDVLFQKGTLDDINKTDKVDGQILLTTDLGLNNKIFADVKQQNGSIDRIRIGGTNDIDESFDMTSTNPLMNKEIASWAISMSLDLETQKEKNVENTNLLQSVSDEFGEYKILWERDTAADEAGYYITTDEGTTEAQKKKRLVNLPQEYNLSEKISEQKQGIIIVFSVLNIQYTVSGKTRKAVYSPKDYHFISRFVHKKEVELFPGLGHSFFLLGSNEFSWSSTALHYLYIADDVIKDNVYNLFDPEVAQDYGSYWTNTPVTGTNGIKYSNSKFCIRAIIGV